MTIDAPLEATAPASRPAASGNNLVTAPILPTLLRLAIPNTIAMVGSTLVSIAETSYIGRLGTVPLAAIALVFPFAMLTQMMSAGAMGGGVSSAISRALGAGDRNRAATLAFHAILIGICGGLLFTAVMLPLGPSFFRLLGGHGDVLEQAAGYSRVLFSGAILIWLVNTLASVIRGTGDMRLPSATLICTGLVQIAAGGTLGLGLFGAPRLGMPGVATGQLIAFSLAAVFLSFYLLTGRSRLTLAVSRLRLDRRMFFDILKVGAVACLSPLQTVLTILIFTRILATFGTETLAGYGIGARLEFLLIPVTFAFGMASVPMVGMAIGAGRTARARQVAWIAAAAAGFAVGLIGLVVAIYPALWVSMFTADSAVVAAASAYLRLAGPAFAFFGIGVSLYFSSQGAAKVGGPVLASTLRLVIVGLGGYLLASADAPAWSLFALVGAAMAAFGICTAASVKWARWGNEPRG